MSSNQELAQYLAYAERYTSTIKSLEKIEKTLESSLISAGGAPNIFNRKKLQEMTALELLLILAPNNIEFIYNA